MKKLLLAALFALGLATVAQAAFFDFNQITIDNTAGGVGLTAAKITPFLTFVQCRVRTAEISYAYAGAAKVTVSSSVGTLAEPGEFITLTSLEEISNFRAIRTGATSAQIDCHWKYTQAP